MTDTKNDERYVFTATFRVKPDAASDFAIALETLFSKVERKPDLLYYYWLRSHDEDGRILVHEAWASRERFKRDEASQPYRADFQDLIAPMLSEERAVHEWDVVSTFRKGSPDA